MLVFCADALIRKEPAERVNLTPNGILRFFLPKVNLTFKTRTPAKRCGSKVKLSPNLFR